MNQYIKSEVIQKLVFDFFKYKDGILFWKKHRWFNKVDTPVGRKCKKSNGVYYLRVDFFGKTWGIHQLVFVYHNGYLPSLIDHEDGNTLNNNISNLRAATKSQNCANRIVKIGSTSKYLGVWKRKNKIKEVWRSDMTFNGKRIIVGAFNTETEAALAYNKKAVQLHGEFARLNIIK